MRKTFFFFYLLCYNNNMNLKKSVLRMFVPLCLLASLVLCLAPIKPCRVFCDTNSSNYVCVINGVNLQHEPGNFSYDNAKGGITLRFRYTVLSTPGDSLVYFYTKQDSKTDVCAHQINSVINLSDYPYANTTFDPIAVSGPGTYYIFAQLNHAEGEPEIIDGDRGITITVEPPSSVNDYIFKIFLDKIDSQQQEFPTFKFSCSLTYNNNDRVNESNYRVYWYTNKNEIVSTMKTYEFKPTEMGEYNVYAVVYLGDTVEIKSETKTFNVSQNKTMTVIIGSLSFAGVLTVIVLLTCWVKIRKERVW